jgi:hypothetical protein
MPSAVSTAWEFLDKHFQTVFATVWGVVVAVVAVVVVKPVKYFWAVRKGKWHLRNLSDRERLLLKGYFERGVRSLWIDYEFDETAMGLEASAILYKPEKTQRDRSTIVGRKTPIPFNISDWAWDYLKRHPELLTASPSPRVESET